MSPDQPKDSNISEPDLKSGVESVSEEVIDRYLAGESLSSSEVLAVEAFWRSSHPSVRFLVSRPGSTYLKGHQKYKSADLNTMWLRTTERLAEVRHTGVKLDAGVEALNPGDGSHSRWENKSPGKEGVVSSRISAIRGKWNLLGLAVLLMIVLPTIFIQNSDHDIFDVDSGVTTVGETAAESSFIRRWLGRSYSHDQLRTVVANVGHPVNYLLPDGSSVLLAPGSHMSYREDFGNSTRDITLEGEALFTVTQSTASPFVVNNGNSAVRVLGTTFSVRRYREDTALTIVVAEGRISVDSEVLTTGDMASVGSDGAIQIERGADVSSALSWTTGTLTFKRIPLRDVLPQLERWYNLTFTVSDPSMLDQPITGSFLTNASVGAVNSMAMLLGANIVQDGDHITFNRPIE